MTTLAETFAQQVTFGTAQTRRPSLVAAFSEVPREKFAGPGPYALTSMLPGRSGYIESERVEDLYQDVLVALDKPRRINIGQPSLWAYIFAQAEIDPGMTIFQSGSGSGYYTAVLARIVGAGGQIFYEEIDAPLVSASKTNLSDVGNATYTAEMQRPFDRAFYFYGCSRIRLSILRLTKEGGRIVLPATNKQGRGRMLTIARLGQEYHFSLGQPIFFIPDANYPQAGLEPRTPTSGSWSLPMEVVSSRQYDGWIDLASIGPSED